MKIAVISDIHAMLAALQAVLQDIDRLGDIDEIWCLGDVVGYGPQPLECWRLVTERCRRVVLGNHEAAVNGSDDHGASARPWFTDGVQLARNRLPAAELERLREMPTRQRVTLPGTNWHIALAHGSYSLDDPWKYVFDPRALPHAFSPAEEAAGIDDCRVVLLGHTHSPFFFNSQVGYALQLDREYVAQPEVDAKYVVNVGSVGLPRVFGPEAQYVVLELLPNQTIIVSPRFVEFDVESVLAAARKVGLSDTMQEIIREAFDEAANQ